MGRTLPIPESEFEFKATRSGGPGGQHVNTSSTRVEVRWNLVRSTAPTDAERARLMEQLGPRLDGEGWIRVVSSATRSQLRNREAAKERLVELIARALVVPKARKPTKMPKAVRAERLEAKRRQGRLKADRRRPRHDD